MPVDDDYSPAGLLQKKHYGKDVEDAISGTEIDAPFKGLVYEGDVQISTRLPDGTRQIWLPPRISKGKTLGGGVSGLVELLPDGNVVKSPWGGEEEADCRKDLKQEADIYNQLHNAFGEHHRFVRFISFDEKESELILQYMSNGTLREYLKDHGGDITRSQRLRWVSSAAEGLDMLHSLEIIHCDFSPKNFLLDAALDLKVADFGCSAYVGRQTSGCGSCRFYPPKDWKRRPMPLPTLDDDLFALGSSIYHIMTGHRPFDDIPSDHVPRLVGLRQLPDLCGVDMGDIIRDCWLLKAESAHDVRQSVEICISGDINEARESGH
ncbi:hypothetical protein LTS10_004174 [Elasticomyces elasticus]|nr:hypothetical protein LTS10_004174 [Elasticomyces elasticus]